MTQESYQDRLRRSSSESRYDPLRDAARRLIAVWHQEDDLEKNDLSEDFWRAMGNLEMALRSVMRGGEDEVPEVEVTDDRSPLPVEAPEMPVAARRSGAKNVSDPMYQNAFIEAARSSMGQPSKADAEALLGYTVALSFNDDRSPAQGVLTDVTEHPARGFYLVLDSIEYPIPLNSVQEIRKVR